MAKAATRLHVPDDLTLGAVVTLSEAQAHQLRAVLRLETGATVALFNGRDGEWLAQVSIAKRAATAQATLHSRPQSSPFDIRLVFAPIKQDRMGFLVEKAVELGVARLQPVMTARTQGGRINIERLAHTAREAAEQCERLDVPSIDPVVTLDAFLKDRDSQRAVFACFESGETRPALSAFSGHAGPADILIGPEGGFTPEEFALLRGAANIHPVSLGPLILRAETAAIAALALWQQSGHHHTLFSTP